VGGILTYGRWHVVEEPADDDVFAIIPSVAFLTNGNVRFSQEQWKRGQPVMISDVDKNLSEHLWSPNSFIRDFGTFTNELIDCATGLTVVGKTMKQFWDGFEDESRRLKDSNGRPMLLKLKDWPMSSDFSDTVPSR